MYPRAQYTQIDFLIFLTIKFFVILPMKEALTIHRNPLLKRLLTDPSVLKRYKTNVKQIENVTKWCRLVTCQL